MQTIKTILQKYLSSDCQEFIDIANDLSEEQFREQNNEKWSIAEVMQHLYLSARPVARLMTGPPEGLVQWGEATEPSRTHEEIASAYAKILATGVKAPATMSPRPEDLQVGKSELMERFALIYRALIDVIDKWSDQELDTYRIPHPVLGKLTVREMLIFTSVHTQHHLRLLPDDSQ